MTVRRRTRFLASAARKAALWRFNVTLILSISRSTWPRDFGVDLGALEGRGRARLPGVKNDCRAEPCLPDSGGALSAGVAGGARLVGPKGISSDVAALFDEPAVTWGG